MWRCSALHTRRCACIGVGRLPLIYGGGVSEGCSVAVPVIWIARRDILWTCLHATWRLYQVLVPNKGKGSAAVFIVMLLRSPVWTWRYLLSQAETIKKWPCWYYDQDIRKETGNRLSWEKKTTYQSQKHPDANSDEVCQLPQNLQRTKNKVVSNTITDKIFLYLVFIKTFFNKTNTTEKLDPIIRVLSLLTNDLHQVTS